MSENLKETGLADAQGDFVIYSIYIKDMSFENPRPPIAYEKVSPDIGMELRVNVMKLINNASGSEQDGGKSSSNDSEQANLFEVSLIVSITSKFGDDVGFILQMEFAGIFGVPNDMKDEIRDVILFVHCANVLFPYVRKIVSETIGSAGYQPLLIQPVNFMGMYRNNKMNGNKGGEVADDL